MHEPRRHDWTQIEPLLDEAMEALDGTDRAARPAPLLRKQILREVGQPSAQAKTLAQKRVSRAVETPARFFTNAASPWARADSSYVISANAVQAAPVGLALTISTAAALAVSAFRPRLVRA